MKSRHGGENAESFIDLEVRVWMAMIGYPPRMSARKFICLSLLILKSKKVHGTSFHKYDIYMYGAQYFITSCPFDRSFSQCMVMSISTECSQDVGRNWNSVGRNLDC